MDLMEKMLAVNLKKIDILIYEKYLIIIFIAIKDIFE